MIAASRDPGAAEPYFRLLHENPRRKLWTANALIDAMDATGIDRAWTMNWGWGTLDLCRQTNDALLESAARRPARLLPFVMAPPASGDAGLREIERCAGAVGIGELMPAGQEDDESWSGLHAIARLAGERGLIVLVHASEPVGHAYPGKGVARLDRLVGLAAEHPATRFVFAHLGGGLPFYHLMPEIAALTNVWYDTAAAPFLYTPAVYRRVVDLVGADRLLFASDGPLLSYRRALRHLDDGGLTSEERAAVLGGNAQRLVGLLQ